MAAFAALAAMFGPPQMLSAQMSVEEFRRFVEEIFGSPTAVVTDDRVQPAAGAQTPEMPGAAKTKAKTKTQPMEKADKAYGTWAPAKPGGGAAQRAFAVVDRGETVRSRARPDYDALGLHAGAFILFPEFAVSETFDDNIYRKRHGEKSDFVSVLYPNLRVVSNWNRHALEADIGGALGFYARNSQEDYQDFHALLNGRIDVSAVSQIHAGAGVRKLHEERDSPDDADALRATEYYDYSASADYSREFGRVKLTLGGTVDRLDYLDNKKLDGANVVELNNDDRDRVESFGRVRVAYAFKTASDIYLESAIGRIEYDASRDDSLLDRDAMDYRSVVGIESDLDGVVSAGLFAGYIRRDFDDTAFSTIDGLTVGGKVVWNATPLTTVTADADRTISTTTINNASGALVTEAGITVDHELLRNVILQLKTRWKESDYNGIDRVDDTFRVGLGADLLLNRNFTLSANYSHAERLSNSSDNEYSQNLLLLSLKTKF